MTKEIGRKHVPRLAGSLKSWPIISSKYQFHQMFYELIRSISKNHKFVQDITYFHPILLNSMHVEATRLNWYRDSSEWKPFHHDAAALKPDKVYIDILFLSEF